MPIIETVYDKDANTYVVQNKAQTAKTFLTNEDYDEIDERLDELEENGGGGGSYTETDPTVPAWAKASTKPSYGKGEVGLGNVDNVRQYSASNPPPYPVTSVNGKTGAVSLGAGDVGADASGTASTAVSNHNVSEAAHNDIRLLIQGLTTRLDALANSDDTTLDQMAELVAYIKANRGLIEQVTTNKVNVSDIVNNLTTNVSNKPLSAAQGVALKALIDALDTALDGKLGGADLTKALIVNKLGYTPADKAYEYPTPQEYGAKGDGSTDDTTAFRNALAANRVVFVPGGTYKLSGELTLGQSVCLKLSPDTVLDFTQTTGNCISMRASSSIEANHALIKVPETFSGRVINIYAGLDEDLWNVPPFTHWGPMWNAARYITDLHIAKINRYGGARSVGGVCAGTAVYLGAHRQDGLPYLWAVDLSRLRIAGGFQYGIHLDTVKVGMDAWIHQTRISAFISGAEIGVYCKESTLTYLDVMVLPEKASDDTTVFAKHGIMLENSTNVDLSGSRVMDWDANHSLWTEGGMYQHLALIGDCSGAILSEHYYYDTPTHDIRSLIYTDTPSNLERLTILQEPITRWFRPVDMEPWFDNGETTKRLALSEDLDEIASVEKLPNFTNVLSTAIDKSGAIFEGAGFVRYGMRWSGTDGSLITNQPYYGCTGLIAIQPGDRVYLDGLKLIYGTDTNPNVVVFNSSYERVNHATAGNIVGQTYYYGYEETEEGFIVDIKPTQTNAAYVAFSFSRNAIGAKPRISINNPISYTLSGVLAEGIKVIAGQIVGLPEPGTGPKGDKGDKGNGIKSVVLNADYTLTFTFDDDTSYTTPNIRGATGGKGADGKTPVAGVDYYTPDEKAEFESYIAAELAKRGQVKPEFANSIEECTDTTKLYVLPDGYIYAYMPSNGPSYTNVLDEVGYSENVRISTSANYTETTANGYDLSGYVLLKVGDVVRMQDIALPNGTGYDSTFYAFDTSKNGVGKGTVNYLETNGAKPVWTDGNLTEFTVVGWMWGSGITEGYIRFGAGNIDDTSILTINEEITESNGGGYTWQSTGHAFVPADYEGRIVGLEQKVTAQDATNADFAKRISAVENYDVAGLPDYAIAERDSVRDALYEKLTLGNVAIIGFSTDQHTSKWADMEATTNTTGTLAGLRALRSLTHKIPFNAIVLGGDYVTGNSVQSIQTETAMVFEQLIGAGCPVVGTAGNHDSWQNNSAITDGDIFKSHTAHAVMNYHRFVNLDTISANGYIDDPTTSLRYIILDAEPRADGSTNSFSTITANLTAMLNGMPDGYNAIIFSHKPLNNSLGDSFKDEVDNKAVLEANASKIICCVNGHGHLDASATSKGVLYIQTTCAGIDRPNDIYDRTVGTANETAFDVFVVDQINRKIHAIRYGAGENREFSY